MIKILGVGGLALLCLIPLGFIADLINERESVRDQALMEVSSSWAREQRLAGPFLSIPFQFGGKENCVSRAVLLPEELEVKSEIQVESRTRGIFETTVYRSRLRFSGYFTGEDIQLDLFSADQFLWDKAVLAIGITDSRGIEGKPELDWGGSKLPFLPGSGGVEIVERGIHVNLPEGSIQKEELPFAFDLTIRGSEGLWFAPTAGHTLVEAQSNWTAPSFSGSFLPSHRDVGTDRFESTWEISYLARDYPQSWDQRSAESDELKRLLWDSYFGVRLLQPIDLYRKMLRSVKYGVLFVGFTFLGFFLFETLTGLRIHPIQYLAIGTALAVFYLLVLSLAEHFGFGISFLTASAANVLLITGYCKAFLGKTGSLAVLSLSLSGLYLFLYVLLQLEDFALLVGSLAVFLSLALFMFLTRRLDWYQVSLRTEDPNQV
jgi:inner membrane protein